MIKHIRNKITSLVIITLLFSVVLESGPFYPLPALSTTTAAASSPIGVTISPGFATINPGNPLDFSAQVTGGSGNYVYQWYLEKFNPANKSSITTHESNASVFNPVNQGSVTTHESNTYEFNTNSFASSNTTGTWGVYVIATDSSGNTGQSGEAMITVTNGSVQVMGNLQVQVSDKSGFPINGAAVTMIAAPGSQSLLSGVTDSAGQYTFQNIIPGSYAVKVSPTGYTQVGGSVAVSSGQTAEIEFMPVLDPESVGGSLQLNTVLPNAEYDSPYSITLDASGGVLPYTYSVTANYVALTNMNLSLDSQTGVISGTPNKYGPTSFIVTVSDSGGHHISKEFTLVVVNGPIIASTTNYSIVAQPGQSYSQQLVATGGSGTGYTFSIYSQCCFSGTGLALSATGLISGMPTTPGVYPFIAKVADSTGSYSISNLAIVVGPVITRITHNMGPASGANSVTITGIGLNNVKQVDFGSSSVSCGSPTSCTVVSDSQMTVTVPAGPQSGGVVNVTAITSNGYSSSQDPTNSCAINSPLGIMNCLQYKYLPTSVSSTAMPQTSCSGVTLSPASPIGFSYDTTLSSGDDTNSGTITLDASGNISPSFSACFTINGLSLSGVTLTESLQTSGNIAVTATGSSEYSGTMPLSAETYVGIIQAGLVSIAVNVQPVFIGDATFNAAGEIGLSQGSTVTVNQIYTNTNGNGQWSTPYPTVSCTNGGSTSYFCIIPVSGASIQGSVRGALGLQVSFDIEDIGGPEVTPNIWLRADGGVNEGFSAPNPPQCSYDGSPISEGSDGTDSTPWYGLCTGMGIDIGGNLDIDDIIDVSWNPVSSDILSDLLAASVTIHPSTMTLLQGQSQSFSADVAGSMEPVNWSASGGTPSSESSSNLDYTAPASSGTDTITATAIDTLPYDYTDVDLNSDTATVTVISPAPTPSPTTSLSPTSGTVGSQITITGTGFAATSTVTIKYDTTTITTATTNSAGIFTTDITVPTSTAGSHTVTSTDANHNTASSTFTVIPPAVPTGVTATAQSTTSITITWTASVGATSYNVLRSTSQTGTFTSVGTPTGSSFTDQNLSPNTQYFYEITASNSVGTSTPSTPVSVTTTSQQGTSPSTPTGILVESLSSTSISLGWTASNGATSYAIYRSTSITGPFTTPVGTSPTTSFTDQNLSPNTTYFYEITASNSVGTSAPSSIEEIETEGNNGVTLSTLSDNFDSDTSLNTDLWQINGPVGNYIFTHIGSPSASVVTPSISFENGLIMSGVSGTYKTTSIQSIQSFSAPFTLTTTVKGTVANGVPFVLGISNQAGTETGYIAGNLNSANTGYYGIWWGSGTNLGTTKIVPNPSVNVEYTLVIQVDSSGSGMFTVSSNGVQLGQITEQVGTGSFYILLGQFEGSPSTVGANSAVWQSVSLTSSTSQTATVLVNCIPNPVNINSPTSCTATVDGSSPTGTVTFSSSSSTGSFSPSSECTLSSNSCSVSYSDSSAGTRTITADYSGDANNSPSSGNIEITIGSSTGTVLQDLSSCQEVGGTWGSSSTCTVNNLTINPDTSLTISNGITLVVTLTLTNSGTINNTGTITSDDKVYNLDGSTLNNTPNGVININWFNNTGSITNFGNLNIGDYLDNHGGTLANFGTINNNNGLIQNSNGGIVDNNNILNNQVLITNDAGSTITNSGTINDYPGEINNVGGTFNNLGTINEGNAVTGGGIISNGGTITNAGTLNINVSSGITNNANGNINNLSGSFININNAGGSLILETTAILINSGTINNHSAGSNSVNDGAITNNPGGTIINYVGSNLINNNIIANGGTITNSGTIDNNQGTITNSGTISGSGVFTSALTSVTNEGTITDSMTMLSSTTISSSRTLNFSIIVPAGIVLTIPNGVHLNIDFTHYHLLVESGGGVLIKSGGSILSQTESCSPPVSGDWAVTSSCTMTASATAPGNVIVQSGVVLTIPSGLSLTIDLVHYHLIVQSGGGVLVKAGGIIN